MRNMIKSISNILEDLQCVHKPVIDAALVLDALYEDCLKAKSVSTISTELDIPDATVYRILKSWKQAGWVVETPAPTGNDALWIRTI